MVFGLYFVHMLVLLCDMSLYFCNSGYVVYVLVFLYYTMYAFHYLLVFSYYTIYAFHYLLVFLYYTIYIFHYLLVFWYYSLLVYGVDSI